MRVIDIVARVDAICDKYAQYDTERLTDADADIVAALQRAESASVDAEIRRTGGDLREKLLKLRMLAIEKVKGLLPEELRDGVPDGTMSTPNRSEGSAASAYQTGNKSSYRAYYLRTEESSQAERHIGMRKMKQD